MVRIIAASVAMMCLGVCLFAADTPEPAKAPDGQWAVRLKPDAGNSVKGTTEAYNDVITIKGGMFNTQVNAKYGFKPVACTAKTQKGKTVFTAELKDETHGTSLYEFVVRGATIKGTMKWSKTGEDDKPKKASYTFTGSKKKSEEEKKEEKRNNAD